jgi:hypothetical protein
VTGRRGIGAAVATAALLTATGAHGARAARPAAVCPAPLLALVTALDGVDRRLGPNLTLAAYRGLLLRARAAADRVASAPLRADCAHRVGAPARSALEHDLAAYFSWSACLDWYRSAETEAALQFGARIKSCERGGRGSAARQHHWASARRQVRSALRALG